MRSTIRVLGALLAFAGLAACGTPKVTGTPGQKVKTLASPAPPDTILGLTAQPEDVAKLVATVDELYVDAVSIYSLRRDDVVQATLQISHFNKKARPADAEFQKAMVAQIGGQEGTPTTVGKSRVFITQGTQKSVAVWFRDKDIFVLTTRDDFDMPRALLRAAVDIEVTS